MTQPLRSTRPAGAHHVVPKQRSVVRMRDDAGKRRTFIVQNERVYEYHAEKRQAYEVDPGLLDDDSLLEQDVPDEELATHELDSPELDEQDAEHFPIVTHGHRAAARNAVRWGDKAIIAFGPPGTSTTLSEQVINFAMERPLICSVRLHATIAAIEGATSQLLASTLRIRTGVGSAGSVITKSYAFQPSPGIDLDVILPDQPVERLVATVSAIGTGAPLLRVEYTLSIAPTVLT